jgi:hypothetical protein
MKRFLGWIALLWHFLRVVWGAEPDINFFSESTDSRSGISAYA